jgi:hypothetical protein
MPDERPGEDPFPVPAIDEPSAPAAEGSGAVAPSSGSARRSPGRRKGSTRRTGANRGGDTTAATAALKNRKLAADATKALKRFRSEIYAGTVTVAPIPATYVGRTDDEVIDAMVRLLGRNARLLTAVASGGDLLAVVTVGRWVVGLGTAVGVQTGRVDVDSQASKIAGLPQIVEDLVAEGFVAVEPAPGVSSPHADETAIAPDVGVGAARPPVVVGVPV